jgi:hypothetical protein
MCSTDTAGDYLLLHAAAAMNTLRYQSDLENLVQLVNLRVPREQWPVVDHLRKDAACAGKVTCIRVVSALACCHTFQRQFVIPIDQTSTGMLYVLVPRRISGARYQRVTTCTGKGTGSNSPTGGAYSRPGNY